MFPGPGQRDGPAQPEPVPGQAIDPADRPVQDLHRLARAAEPIEGHRVDGRGPGQILPRREMTGLALQHSGEDLGCGDGPIAGFPGELAIDGEGGEVAPDSAEAHRVDERLGVRFPQWLEDLQRRAVL